MKTLFVRRFFGDGKGYSTKLSVKLLFLPRQWTVGLMWAREWDRWYVWLLPLPTLSIRIHCAWSYGGRFR